MNLMMPTMVTQLIYAVVTIECYITVTAERFHSKAMYTAYRKKIGKYSIRKHNGNTDC